MWVTTNIFMTAMSVNYLRNTVRGVPNKQIATSATLSVTIQITWMESIEYGGTRAKISF